MKPRAWLIGALVAGLTAGLAIGQQIALLNLTGNEVVQAELGPGGGGIFTTVAALRNATGYGLVAGGTTVNTSMTTLQNKLMNTGVIGTWNVQFPPSPYDGEEIAISCPGGTATVSIATVSPTTVVGSAFTACSSTAGAEWVYSTSANIWYRNS